MQYRLLAFVVALAGSAGCAPIVARGHASRRRESLTGPPEVNGIWDWMFRSTDDQGDMRVEQEEWHLRRRAGHLEG